MGPGYFEVLGRYAPVTAVVALTLDRIDWS